MVFSQSVTRQLLGAYYSVNRPQSPGNAKRRRPGRASGRTHSSSTSCILMERTRVGSSHLGEDTIAMPMTDTYPPIVRVIQDCEAVCNQMATCAGRMPDVQSRSAQLHLLRDCADICDLTSRYIAGGSPFSRESASFCADVCEACASECMRHPDPASQHCARVCCTCAGECRAYAMAIPPVCPGPGQAFSPYCMVSTM